MNAMASRGPGNTITVLVFLGITLIFVIARLISKRIKRQSLTASDWALLAGLLFSSWITATDVVGKYYHSFRQTLFF